MKITTHSLSPLQTTPSPSRRPVQQRGVEVRDLVTLGSSVDVQRVIAQARALAGVGEVAAPATVQAAAPTSAQLDAVARGLLLDLEIHAALAHGSAG